MNDLISRQAAIDAVCTHGTELERRGITVLAVANHKQVTVDLLEQLPSAQPEQRWIPCSERLPDLWDERYLVSLAWGGVGVMEYKSTGFHNYGSFSPVPIETVTAWMPLPEPYKEDEHEAD